MDRGDLMSDNENSELLKQAAQLEKDVSKLYMLYSDIFSKDREFWRQIAKEEIEHAALIEVAMDYPDFFPKGLADSELPRVKEISDQITKTIQEYKNKPPSKDQACNYALKVESSAWELHYQKLATRMQDSEALKIFQRINDGDKNHIQRISEFRNKE